MSLIILDRDGVINYESKEYIKTPDEWRAIPGSLKAVSTLNRAGYEVVIASNQSGVGRGLYDLPMLGKIHEKMLHEVQAEGGCIADIFFCPHHPDEGCFCRKPQPGMFYNIREKYKVDFSDVFFIGDSIVDIQVAKTVGCKPLLVLTGNGQLTLASYAEALHLPSFTDLAQAAEYVCTRAIHAK